MSGVAVEVGSRFQVVSQTIRYPICSRPEVAYLIPMKILLKNRCKTFAKLNYGSKWTEVVWREELEQGQLCWESRKRPPSGTSPTDQIHHFRYTVLCDFRMMIFRDIAKCCIQRIFRDPFMGKMALESIIPELVSNASEYIRHSILVEKMSQIFKIIGALQSP